ncbi:MAG: type IV pili methyl-accepting chemotaxis transducer N-terminal domain-containing protein, partial [Nitrospirota bacterium]|nr:type IV pili methyl-accepting chemotaxis transducer N-terminal domain-containing protein [Nitrospirota bacterium]
MMRFKSLTAKYVFLSSILLLFFGLCFSAAFYFVRYMEGDAKKINLGGRQRMLTYDISSHMHFITVITGNGRSSAIEHHIKGAEKAMDEYENALYSLKDGGEKIGLEPVHDEKSIAQLTMLIDLWQNTQRPLLRDIMRNPARGGEETCNACHAAIRANFDKVEQLVQYLEAHHDREIRNFSRFGLLALGILAGMTAFFFVFVKKNLIIPAKDLKAAAAEVEKGNFDVSIDVQTHDEIGALGNTFNAMAHGLKALFHEKAEHVQKLNVLNSVAMAASQTLTLEVMLDKVLTAIRSLKPFEK